MTDFIAYVVAELKSKRLTKSSALSLIRQFSGEAAVTGAASRIHPLVHRNTSDLSQQNYSTSFNGDEFFLADHRILGEKVLPGAAYLEMARAAIQDAMPDFPENGIFRFCDIIWAQPIVVSDPRDVSISLFLVEAEPEDSADIRIEFEIYSQFESEGGIEQTVHAQGNVLIETPVQRKLDIRETGKRMRRGKLDSTDLYSTYAKIGVDYGVAHQGLVEILQGNGELLAEIRLPAAVDETIRDYLLHPSLMDAVLQSPIGFIKDTNILPERTRLPFSLKSMAVLASPGKDVVAWVRHAPGSDDDAPVTVLDIDVCDREGNVCIEIRGFTSREIANKPHAGREQKPAGMLYAHPVWESVTPASMELEFASHHIIACGFADETPPDVPGAMWHFLPASENKNLAGRYTEMALACFQQVKSAMAGGSRGKHLIQLTVADDKNNRVAAGVSALFKTAALENPAIVGQVILVEPATSKKDLAAILQAEKTHPHGVVIKYQNKQRSVMRLAELDADNPGNQLSGDTRPPVAFKDSGTYLITGGLGGIGLLFAKEIINRTTQARVILAGRSKLTEEKKNIIAAGVNDSTRISYEPFDVSNRQQVETVIAKIIDTHKQLDGIIHAAGIIQDKLIPGKEEKEFLQVYAAKVAGTDNLDRATANLGLDFFALFSAGASVMGNAGQADYASANGFMDCFAEYRNGLVEGGQRQGRTVAINWPMWQEGGMQVDQATQARLRHEVGMLPMSSAAGIDAFYRALQMRHSQVITVAGDLHAIRAALFAKPDAATRRSAVNADPAPGQEAAGAVQVNGLTGKTEDFLKQQLSSLLRIPVRSIDARASFEKYGIDSIMTMNLTSALEKTFGSLPKTLFFEYQSLSELTRYFIETHGTKLRTLFESDTDTRPGDRSESVNGTPGKSLALETPPKPISQAKRKRSLSFRGSSPQGSGSSDPIAIVGLSGRYPQAWDIAAFWQNLRDGVDSISEIPPSRWDWRKYYTPDRAREGHHFSKWGGFIDGIDEFDPRFFNISPREASFIEPQERLFLQHCWQAIEDAGETRESLQLPRADTLAGQVGVYVGVMYSEYQMFGAEAVALGKPTGLPGSYASIANRVSYSLNLHGPSMAVDTMCSSSLTAVHLACQDLKLGLTDLAIAGAVNLSIHPNKYFVISSGQFISSDGHCQSFGIGGDGYIPGEGVGVVVLKRLSEAERDGNPIYGIIRGSSLNHGGKTNGYSVPNPRAQTDTISRALTEAKVNPRHISYVEAHGTGTKLGDPIEIAALAQAFGRHTDETGFCLIGSAKSNIGHCESAAGIAGLTKVLLQMKHKKIVPSLHSKVLNPHIDFDKTPFIVNQTLRDWEQPVVNGRRLPRIAGISSFGAGGSNAHLILEEYASDRQDVPLVSSPADNPEVVVPLSARTAEQLQQKAADLLAFLENCDGQEYRETAPIDLDSVAYTLQVGREAMDHRLGLLVKSTEELKNKLRAFVGGERETEGLYQGRSQHQQDPVGSLSSDEDFQETLNRWIAARKLPRIVELWVSGLQVDWNKLYGANKPKRVSLPAYPFSREKYWAEQAGNNTLSTGGAFQLHPFLHSNTSDLAQQRYSSVFTGQESFLEDHQVTADGLRQKVFPAVAYLEMARAAIANAVPGNNQAIVPTLCNVVLERPLAVSDKVRVTIELQVLDNGRIAFEIASENAVLESGGEKTVHCRGEAEFHSPATQEKADIGQLQNRMPDVLGADAIYRIFSGIGIHYGPSYRGMVNLHRGTREVLSQLHLSAPAGRNDFQMPPGLLDSALQSAIGLLDNPEDLGSEPPLLPFALDTLQVFSPFTDTMFAWVRHAEGNGMESGILKLDIDLYNEQGMPVATILGYSARALRPSLNIGHPRGAGTDLLIAAPSWEVVSNSKPAGENIRFDRHDILVCGFPSLDTGELAGLVPGSRCQFLKAEQGDPAAHYTETAIACFQALKEALGSRAQGNALVQLFINSDTESLLAGLSGLLRTASLENPRLKTQLILVDPEATTERIANIANVDKHRVRHNLIRYRARQRYLQVWREAANPPQSPDILLKDKGVYLITGGTGGLGILFAREILAQTSNAKIILTGRSALTTEKRELVDSLPADKGSVFYRQLDIGNLAQVSQAVAGIVDEFGQLNGIIHSAGMTSDSFIVKKTADEFARVLQPKVTGVLNLDQATQDVDLDFVALFSSTSGVIGNIGQADYAAANGFLDCFADYRNQLAEAKRRRGRTVSINWPLWHEGGMSVDASTMDGMAKLGIRPLETPAGMRAFHFALNRAGQQSMVLQGDPEKLRALLAERVNLAATPTAQISRPEGTVPPYAGTDAPALVHKEPIPSPDNAGNTVEKAQRYLRELVADDMQLSPVEIDANLPLENYGMDSVVAMRLTNALEKDFGPLSKTLFFEYQTLGSLAAFLAKEHAWKFRADSSALETANAGATKPGTGVLSLLNTARRPFQVNRAGQGPGRTGDIAIVGLGGRYPQADTLDEFWENLKAGRDCITEIPPERWNHALYFDASRKRGGTSYAKWGGFINDVDKFDALFFNISPKEAALIDPQERLFLETVWQTVENAGYSKQSLAACKVGVYVGAMWSQYQLYGADPLLSGNEEIASSSFGSIANRVSYLFDFHGPSIALDTMCSSSLTAIHLACEEIRKGGIDVAIAGGVNLSTHPNKYLNLSQGSFMASDGRCRSFGDGGDGYVPGEGVGALMLKPLEKALEDGDAIHAVIKATAINHGGKTNGYTVPNPVAQADLILQAVKQANITPDTLGYIETHGTGTALGDPIEVTGLTRAFESTNMPLKAQACPIGSVKSNIGHLEAAAAIAGVTKVLLQFKHRQLVPSLHAETLNPNINFKQSPFYVQTALSEWENAGGTPRRASVSSFGAGGSNGHLILEEFVDERELATEESSVPQLFILSAANHDSLRRYADKVVRFLEHAPQTSIVNLAYTSQVGRTAMNERLAVIAANITELQEKLRGWQQQSTQSSAKPRPDRKLSDVYTGNTRDVDVKARNLIDGEAGQALLNVVVGKRDLEKLANLWIAGVDVDWPSLHAEARPRRIAFPTYPFARERHWIKLPDPPARPGLQVAQPPAPLAAEEIGRAVYLPVWQADQGIFEDSFSGDAVIVFDADDTVAGQLEQVLLSFGQPRVELVRVSFGDAYSKTASRRFTVNPENEQEFVTLVDSLQTDNLQPGKIIYADLHSPALPIVESADDAERAARASTKRLYALFHLCKALMNARINAVDIVSLCASASGVENPAGVALEGFYKTLCLENPNFRGKVLEIDSPGISVASAVDLLIREFNDAEWKDTRVRYLQRHNSELSERNVKRFTAFNDTANAAPELPLKQGGVYIITGGLGGLGLIFSQYLAKRFAAKLVLCGRSDQESQQEKLDKLCRDGADAIYVQADVSKAGDAEKIVSTAIERFSQVNGIIHSAGINRDAFILNKTREELDNVIGPKVPGVINLDFASRFLDLDLFVMFSSVASITGNVGQSDYAYANSFLDSFAAYRNDLVQRRERCGKSLAINWPYWENGGITLSAGDLESTAKATGMLPMPNDEGIAHWESVLKAEHPQWIALFGNVGEIGKRLQPGMRNRKRPDSCARQAGHEVITERTRVYLRKIIGAEIRLSEERVDVEERFESFGIDSVAINKLNANLERDLGALPKTLFYEYDNVADLADYLVREAGPALINLFDLEDVSSMPAGNNGDDGNRVGAVTDEKAVKAAVVVSPPAIHSGDRASISRAASIFRDNVTHAVSEPIAIIGVHGSYPRARDLNEYWKNLKKGRNSVDLVPASRWSYEAYFDPDPAKAEDGKIYCKWGGFIEDVDKFDADFFNISANEAMKMDPQERLFLQSVWSAFEDAGYTRQRLKTRYPKGKSANVGVFVGVTTNTYHLLGPEERARGNMVTPASLPWSIANRVSYYFDFQGPSIPVDTACSSSLVAIDMACESLRTGNCGIAVAGGVNLYLHPSKYQAFCQSRMVSTDGRTHSYGAGDDGFVPSEGIGSLILKPLGEALRDNDPIHGIIRGSDFNHSGRSNGYSAPNPNSQASVIENSLRKADISADSLGYIEGHGTGTQLGDSLEVTSLSSVFRRYTDKRQFCPLGSVKANIGHPEAAAGVAGISKVLLQFKHRQIVPAIYSDQPNPNIDFAASPFYLQDKLTHWKAEADLPRRAIVNAFGSGGVNACVVLEEYRRKDPHNSVQNTGPYLLVLSARNEARLRAYGDRVLAFLGQERTLNMADFTYTLQVGREEMPYRLAIVAADKKELIESLKQWRENKGSETIFTGQAEAGKGSANNRDSATVIEEASRSRDSEHVVALWARVAQLWVAGSSVDWETLYRDVKPSRISAPTYPFAKERYWISEATVAAQPRQPAVRESSLHPLVSYNSSTLRETRFSSILSEREYFSSEHVIGSQMIFPGAGFLEMACIAGNIAGERSVAQINDMVWVQPLIFDGGPRLVQTSLQETANATQYVITSVNEEGEKQVHSEGRLRFLDWLRHPSATSEYLQIDKLRKQSQRRLEPASFYEAFRSAGFNYGPAFRTVEECFVSDSYVLSKLTLADHVKPDFDKYILHPTLLDGAFQTVVAMAGKSGPSQPHLPFAIENIRILHPLARSCYVYIERAETAQAGVEKFNIRITNMIGEVLVDIGGFCVRPTNLASFAHKETATETVR